MGVAAIRSSRVTELVKQQKDMPRIPSDCATLPDCDDMDNLGFPDSRLMNDFEAAIQLAVEIHAERPD